MSLDSSNADRIYVIKVTLDLTQAQSKLREVEAALRGESPIPQQEDSGNLTAFAIGHLVGRLGRVPTAARATATTREEEQTQWVHEDEPLPPRRRQYGLPPPVRTLGRRTAVPRRELLIIGPAPVGSDDERQVDADLLKNTGVNPNLPYQARIPEEPLRLTVQPLMDEMRWVNNPYDVHNPQRNPDEPLLVMEPSKTVVYSYAAEPLFPAMDREARSGPLASQVEIERYRLMGTNIYTGTAYLRSYDWNKQSDDDRVIPATGDNQNIFNIDDLFRDSGRRLERDHILRQDDARWAGKNAGTPDPRGESVSSRDLSPITAHDQDSTEDGNLGEDQSSEDGEYQSSALSEDEHIWLPGGNATARRLRPEERRSDGSRGGGGGDDSGGGAGLPSQDLYQPLLRISPVAARLGMVGVIIYAAYKASQVAPFARSIKAGILGLQDQFVDTKYNRFVETMSARLYAAESWISSHQEAFASTTENVLAAARVTGEAPELWKTYWTQHAAANAQKQLDKKFGEWQSQELGYGIGNWLRETFK